MTRNTTVSIVILAPMIGIGSVLGLFVNVHPHSSQPILSETIWPSEMHRNANVNTLRDQYVSSLF